MAAEANPNEKTRTPSTQPESHDLAQQADDAPGRDPKPANPDREDESRGKQGPEREERGNDRIEPGEEHTADRPEVKPTESPSDLE